MSRFIKQTAFPVDDLTFLNQNYVDMKQMVRKNISDLYRVKFSDIILIILIFLFTAGTVAAAKQGLNKPLSNVPEALVFHEGQILKELKLDKDQDISLLDGKVCLEIKGKKLRVKHSDCSHQTCVHMGWIHNSGETIACIPNNILIQIKQEDAPVVDAVIY